MLRLKEQPAEWIKFTLVTGVALNLLAWLPWWRESLPDAVRWLAAGLAIVAFLLSLLRPRWFRGFYRGGMRASFHVGQVVGGLLLVVIFFVVLTPIGLLLHLSGRDLLKLRRDPQAATGWQKAKDNREFDRMF